MSFRLHALKKVNILGSLSPLLNEDVFETAIFCLGYWKVVQIGGLGGNSRYCVNPLDGNEVSGTRVDAQKEMPTCGGGFMSQQAESTVMTLHFLACHKELETLLTRIPIPGKFIPACDESGVYFCGPNREGLQAGLEVCFRMVSDETERSFHWLELLRASTDWPKYDCT